MKGAYYMSTLKIYQGSTYRLPFKLKISGEYITPEDVKEIELSLGKILKVTYPEVITYDYENKCFILPLTQENTFLIKKVNEYQVRILFADGSVKSTDKIPTEIVTSLSKEVLT